MRKRCIICGTTFDGALKRDKLCSERCRAERARQRGRDWAKRHRSSEAYKRNVEKRRAWGRAWRQRNRIELNERKNQAYWALSPEQRHANNQAAYRRYRDRNLINARKYREQNREKIAEAQLAYRQRNAEKLKEKRRLYRERNREKIKAWIKAWCERNADYLKDKKRSYYYQNRERLRESQRKHRELHREEIRERGRDAWAKRRAARDLVRELQSKGLDALL